MSNQSINWQLVSDIINPFLLCDGYKTSHPPQYPDGTTFVCSNFTPRSNKYAPQGCEQVVSFGQQMTMIEIHSLFQYGFFSKPKNVVCQEIKREYSLLLGVNYDVSRIERLHDLGYLPIEVKILEEGTLVPIRVPVLTIKNTHPDFFWVTNFLETIISNLLWKPMTSATIAHSYRKLLSYWQQKTDIGRAWFVDWQAHDFSMRGMDGIGPSITSGLGHATSFMGSDTLPVINGARKYYNAQGQVIGTVPATEHSVMCAGKKDDEVETIRRLFTIYPTGILGVVADTWDLWKVCTQHVRTLKNEILARDGKLVLRPDSGNPVDIICGHKEFTIVDGKYYTLDNRFMPDRLIEEKDIPACKGVIELLWEVFGGTINDQGYKVLDTHIGALYGDSITIARAEEICQRLADKGFASTNIVLGVGSFTYQFNTRDTFGFAMKATFVIVNGEEREIFKDPITDDGTKKSATGLGKVIGESGTYELIEKVSMAEEKEGALKVLYRDGEFENITTFEEIRKKLII